MGGSARKPDKPRPSYEDGRARDPGVRRMLDESTEDARGGLLRLLKRAVQQVPKKVKPSRS